MMSNPVGVGTVRIDEVCQNLKYAGQVGIIAVIEFVIQAILVSVCVVIGFLFLHAAVLLSKNKNQREIETWYSSILVILLLIVILILLVVFNGWVVSLVYIGGHKRNAGRLTTWYKIEFFFFVISLIAFFVNIFHYGSSWLEIIVEIASILYRLYSICIVRLHANEIRAQTSIQVYLPNQI